MTIDFGREAEDNCVPFTKTKMTGAMSQKDDGMVMNKKPKRLLLRNREF